MRIPHLRTALSVLGTAAAMSGLVAAKSAGHRPPPKPHALGKSAKGAAAPEVTTVTGPAIPIAHGVVQVRITVSGGLIADVSTLSLPHDNGVSWSRSTLAAQVLRGEVLTAQSARVDAVTGATFTSKAYLQSLQAAIDASDITEIPEP